MLLTAPTVLLQNLWLKRCIRDVHYRLAATGAAWGALLVSYRHSFLFFFSFGLFFVLFYHVDRSYIITTPLSRDCLCTN